MAGTIVPQRHAEESWPESDEIDLGRYLGVLRRRWKEIVLVTVGVVVLTAVGVLLYRQLTPPVYEADATAAIIRTSTDVRFDDRFTTSSEQPGNADVDSRRAALVALVKSGSIAQQVIDELGDQLPLELQSPVKLLNAVQGQMATVAGRPGQSDLINVRVRAKSPDLAATIANTWVKAYVQQVNSIYGQVPDDMLGSVEAQLVEAQAAYDKSQANLESFLATSQLDALTRLAGTTADTLTILQMGKVNALNAYMDSLVASYGSIVQTYVTAQADNQTLAFNKEQEGQRARLSAYLDAYNAAQVDTFTQQNDRYRSELRMYYDQWLRTNSLLTAARTLQDQVADSASGDTLAGSALALQVLNLQMVNGAAATPTQAGTDYLTPGQPQPQKEDKQRTEAGQQSTPLQPTQTTPLQIQLDGRAATPVNAADLRQQVDATVASLEGQLTALQQNITQLNQSLLGGDSFQQLNATVPADSALVQAITDAYPALFQTGVFSGTALHASSDALFAAGQAQAAQFLAKAGQAQAAQFLAKAESDTLPTTNSPDAPMAATIATLEEQLRTLQGQIEVERGRSQQFAQQRDIAWESVKALSNKQAELQLARAAANSEVRLSSQAVPLDEPVARVSITTSLALAAALGLLIGIIVAFLHELGIAQGARAQQL